MVRRRWVTCYATSHYKENVTALRSDATLANWREVIEFLSRKLGLVLLMLGGMHFVNLLFLARVRRRPVFNR